MKKKILAFSLSLMLILAMAVPAMAAQVTTETTSNTAMTYTVAPSYIVNIPVDVQIATETKTGTLGLSVNANAVIPYGESILVKLTVCDFKLENNGDQISYTIKDSTSASVAQGATVLTHGAAVATATEVTLNLAIPADQTPKYSGDYTDQITFAVSVE